MLSQTYLYKISKYLAYFVYQVEIENKANNFDINRHAERFFIPILNIVFDADFNKLEFEQLNYPAVDLGDAIKGITIQITSQKGYSKITHTLSRYVHHKIFEKFPELFHLVIDTDYQTTKTQQDVDNYIQGEVAKLEADPVPVINFPIADRLININQLRTIIEQRCNVEQLQQIAEFLESEYGVVTSLPTFSESLLPYRIAFERQLDTTNNNLPFQFHKAYIGREEDITAIRNFVADPVQRIMTIAADGGYGKTRLCIEYFARDVDNTENMEGFVVSEFTFNQASLAQALTGDKEVIILFDDAHKNPIILRELVEVVARTPKVKLLLTVRNALLDETLRQLPTHNRDIPVIRLKRLSYDETKALIRSLLLGVREEDLVRLTEQSRGVPAVVMAISQRVFDGADPKDLTGDFSFSQFVKELTDQVVEDISRKTYLEKEKIYKTIQLISLCGPLSEAPEELALLAEVNQVEADETAVIIDELRNAEFISRSLRIAIQPDPYSDVIIVNSVSRVKALLRNPRLEHFRERIIKNLMLLEANGRLDVNLNSVLSEFINDLETAAQQGQYQSLQDGLEVILSFAYKKPELAMQILSRLAPTFKTVERPDPKDIWSDYHLREVFESIHKLITIGMLNTQGEAGLEKNYAVVLQYIKPDDLSAISSGFRFKEYDFIEFRYRSDRPCERQLFFSQKISGLIAKDKLEPIEQEIAITGLTVLLNHEITLHTHYEQFTGAYTYGHAEVPRNKTIDKIRVQGFKDLVFLYPKVTDEIKEQIIDLMNRTLFFMHTPTRTSRVEMNMEADMYIAVEFLHTILGDPVFAKQKAKTTRRLQMFQRTGIKAEYQTLYDGLLVALTKAETYEDRLQLFLDSDYFQAKAEVVSFIEGSVRELGSWDSFFAKLIERRKTLKQGEGQNVSLITEYLLNSAPERALEMVGYIDQHVPDEIQAFAILLKVGINDPELIYAKVDYFWRLGTPAGQATAIWILTYARQADKSTYQEKDFDYFNKVIDEKNVQALDNLTYTIGDYLPINASKAIEVIGRIIELDEQRQVYEHLLSHLFDDKAIIEQHADQLKALLYDRCLQLPLDHYFDPALKFLENNFGFHVLLDFLKAKFKVFKEHDALISLYQDYAYHNPLVSDETREQQYLSLIDWYVTLSDADKSTYYDILKLLQPRYKLSDNMTAKLLETIETHKDEREYLLGMAACIRALRHIGLNYMKVMLSIGDKLSVLPGFSTNDMVQLFTDGFYYNFGSKSKVGNGPYDQDVAKKQMLTEVLNTEMTGPSRSLVEQMLAVVNKHIYQASTDDEPYRW